ncbi:MAG: HAD family hydrolase [Candidatus Binataceae bacterium]
MKRAARAAAFYDLDGTLVDFNLVHAALYIVGNLGEWTGRAAYITSFLSRIPRLYAAEKYDRRLLNVVLFAGLKGISRDRLLTLGEEYCERVLSGRIYPQARELVEANRGAGLDPVLVTGSPDFIVAPLARTLGIADFAANRMISSRGLMTGRLHEPIMAGAEKAVWCAEYARSRGFSMAECWGYADSYYDLGFLTALGHPVAVNPDRRLRAASLNRHWPIVRFTMNQETALSLKELSFEGLMRFGSRMWSAWDGAVRS